MKKILVIIIFMGIYGFVNRHGGTHNCTQNLIQNELQQENIIAVEEQEEKTVEIIEIENETQEEVTQVEENVIEEKKEIENTSKPKDEISLDLPEQENSLSFSQKIAKFVEKNQALMNIPFVKKFVDRQLNILPPAKQEEISNTNKSNQVRNKFVSDLSNNGELKKIPPVQRMSDPQKIEEMKRKMEQKQQGNER